jgi:tRNA(Ser,Leu) C12 N-acetylase TAN1
LPSATQIIKREYAEWSDFRRSLRIEDRRVFDRLFAKAKQHSHSVGMAGRVYPLEAILMAMLIEIQKEIDELKKGREGRLYP